MSKVINKALKQFKKIPGIGPSLSQDLVDLGYRGIKDLVRQNPQSMYEQLCRLRGEHIDRCVLYVFRCTVYFASNSSHDPEKLKWWNWKD